MRILHTSDWHLGKVINGVSRRVEQQNTLNELCEICENQDIDVVLVCGDVFNGSNTPSWADEMFLDAVIRMADGGNRAVIVVGGNGDEGTRWTASKKFAEQSNIFLIKELNYEMSNKPVLGKNVEINEVGKGYIKLTKNGESATIVFMPYPNSALLQNAVLENASKEEKLAKILQTAVMNFEKGSLNIIAAHIMVENHKSNYDFHEVYSKNIFPAADYIALGQVHDMLAVDEAKNIYYAGSTIMQGQNESPNKHVIILNCKDDKILNKEFIKLKSPKKMFAIMANDYNDAMKKMQGKEDGYTEVTFMEGSLSRDEVVNLRKAYPQITQFNIHSKGENKITKSIKTNKPEETFEEFYKQSSGEPANELIKEIFSEVFYKEKG
jgi:exonuclease SbcD